MIIEVIEARFSPPSVFSGTTVEKTKKVIFLPIKLRNQTAIFELVLLKVSHPLSLKLYFFDRFFTCYLLSPLTAPPLLCRPL